MHFGAEVHFLGLFLVSKAVLLFLVMNYGKQCKRKIPSEEALVGESWRKSLAS